MGTLKKKIALYLAKKKYFSKSSETRNYKSKITDSSTVLVILPDKAEDILKSLDIPAYFRKNKKSVTLLCEEKHKPIAQEEFSFDVLTYDSLKITKLGLPEKEFALHLKSKNFDVVLDLTREDNFFHSLLSRIPLSGVIVGFKKENADEFYNLQIANNQNNAEISYRNFLNSIQMF